ERGGEVGIAGGIGVAAFTAPAAHGNADGIGAVVGAEGIEYRRAGVIAHGAAAEEALATADGGAEHRAARVAMAEKAGNERITERRETETARIAFRVRGEKVLAGFPVRQRHVEMRAVAGFVGERFG